MEDYIIFSIEDQGYFDAKSKDFRGIVFATVYHTKAAANEEVYTNPAIRVGIYQVLPIIKKRAK